MIKNITQNELILLAYNELPPDKHTKMLQVIKKDVILYAKYLEIRSQMSELDTLIMKPNDTSVQIIKERSCSSSPMETI